MNIDGRAGREESEEMATTALVPAAPERKRILRELLAAPEPWSSVQRDQYRDMIAAEYM